MRDRRRRLLTDESAASAPTLPVRAADDGAPQLYSDAARSARQLGVHALVPLRGWTLALVIGGLWFGAGALVGLHLGAERWQPRLGDASAVLRLDVPGSLGSWLAATLLALAAALAMFVYSLRRHRLDDYHGRYRMWLAMAAAAMVASLFESTQLPVLARELCHQACAAGGLRADVLWPVGLGLLVVAIFGRLGIEIRRVGPAVTSLVLAAGSLVLSASCYHGWPLLPDAALLPVCARGSWLAGYVLLVTTLLFYSRRVQFEVAGESALPARVKRKRPKASAVGDGATGAEPERAARKPALKLRTDLDPVVVATTDERSRSERPQSERTAAAREASETAANTKAEAEIIPAEPHRLSRAERRKLKQQQRRLAS